MDERNCLTFLFFFSSQLAKSLVKSQSSVSLILSKYILCIYLCVFYTNNKIMWSCLMTYIYIYIFFFLLSGLCLLFYFFCSDEINKLCVCVCGISAVATGWNTVSFGFLFISCCKDIC